MNQNELPENLLEYIHVQEGVARILGNKKLYKTLLETFLVSPCMDDLNNQLSQGDLGAATISAHSVKGMAANLSMHALQSIALQLESELKAGQALADTLQTFTDTWNQTMEYCKLLTEKLSDPSFVV